MKPNDDVSLCQSDFASGGLMDQWSYLVDIAIEKGLLPLKTKADDVDLINLNIVSTN